MATAKDNQRIYNRLDRIVESIGELTEDEESLLTDDEKDTIRIVQESLRTLRLGRYYA